MTNINLPEKMYAIDITEFGNSDVLKIVIKNLPLIGEKEILIQVKASGINRPDIVQRQGHYPPPAGASNIPGLEIAGIVVKCGSGVTKYKIGDQVCALLTGGGYAGYAAAHEELTLPIPQGLNFIEAASLPETYFTVWSNIFDQCNFKQGETVLIHGGSSGIGVTAIQLIKAFGGTVLATVGSEEKVKFCYDLGADFVINYKTEDFVEKTMEYTKNHGADIILDIVGGEYVNKNYKAAANGGRISQIAFLHGNLVQINLNYIMRKKLIHTGSTLRAQNIEFKSKIRQNLEKHVWPLFANKTLNPVIDKVFIAQQVGSAHSYMESSNHKGKIILDMSEINI